MNISKDLKIEIRPIPNRNKIREFSPNLEYFSRAITISAFVDPVTLKYATGLSEEDKKYLSDNNCPYDISDTWVQGVAHPFWEDTIAKVNLLNTPTFLYPGKNLLDFIKYKYLLVNKYIYKSEEEMRTGSKPEATHYIYNESIETEMKAKAIEQDNILIRSISDLSVERKRNILLIILNEDMSNKSESYLTVKFEDILANKDQKAHLTELLSSDAKDIALQADIKMALNRAVLRKTKQGIFLFENNLGFSEADVAAFLAKPDNQEIYLTIKSKIE